MDKKWIVVASRSGVTIFTPTKSEIPKILRRWTHPIGRLKNKEILADKPGLNKSSRGAPPYRMTGEKDPHAEYTKKFSATIAKYISLEWLKGSFEQLEVVSEPKMLGMIKSQIKGPLSKKIKWTHKDLKNVPIKKWKRTIDLKPPSSLINQ